MKVAYDAAADTNTPPVFQDMLRQAADNKMLYKGTRPSKEQVQHYTVPL
jgi:hypothetical protein